MYYSAGERRFLCIWPYGQQDKLQFSDTKRTIGPCHNKTNISNDWHSIINEPVGQLCKKSIHLFFNFNTQKILLFFFCFFFFTQDIYKVKVHSRKFILTVTYDCMPLFTSTTTQQRGILWSIRQNCLYFSIFQTCTTLWLNKKLSYYVVG